MTGRHRPRPADRKPSAPRIFATGEALEGFQVGVIYDVTITRVQVEVKGGQSVSRDVGEATSLAGGRVVVTVPDAVGPARARQWCRDRWSHWSDWH